MAYPRRHPCLAWPVQMEEGTQFFAYDRAFGWDASQQDVFDFVAAPLIKGEAQIRSAGPDQVDVEACALLGPDESVHLRVWSCVMYGRHAGRL